MTNLTPTPATALIGPDGTVYRMEYFSALPFRDWPYDEIREVPCLIMPAPIPIEECPEEWKDGLSLMLYSPEREKWAPGCYWRGRWHWPLGERLTPTHILPMPPAPEKAVQG